MAHIRQESLLDLPELFRPVLSLFKLCLIIIAARNINIDQVNEEGCSKQEGEEEQVCPVDALVHDRYRMIVRKPHALQLFVLNIVQYREQLVDDNAVRVDQLEFLALKPFLLAALFTLEFTHDLLDLKQGIVLPGNSQRININTVMLF